MKRILSVAGLSVLKSKLSVEEMSQGRNWILKNLVPKFEEKIKSVAEMD